MKGHTGKLLKLNNPGENLNASFECFSKQKDVSFIHLSQKGIDAIFIIFIFRFLKLTIKQKSLHVTPNVRLRTTWAYFQQSVRQTNRHNKKKTTGQLQIYLAPVLCAGCQMRERKACGCWRLMDCLEEVNYSVDVVLAQNVLAGYTNTIKGCESCEDKTICVIHSSVILLLSILNEIL